MITLKNDINAEVELEKLVKKASVSGLASIKESVVSIFALIKDEEASLGELVRLIEIDPPLTAQVLKCVNSASYSPKAAIYSIGQAAIWVGFERLRDLALSQKICPIFASSNNYAAFSNERVWTHSLATAMLSKMICRMEFGLQGNDAYAAGLLHDIGLITFDQFMHHEFSALLVQADVDSRNICDMAVENWHFSHYDVAAKLLNSWHLPHELSIAIKGQVNPFSVADEYFKLTAVLFIAKTMCHLNGYGYGCTHIYDETLFNSCREALGIVPEALELIILRFNEEFTPNSDEQGT